MSKTLPPPVGPRRKRLLSDEERALWHEVAKSARPLAKKRRTAKPAALEAEATEAPMPAPKAAAKTPVPKPPARPLHKPSAPPLAPLGRRERSQLSRGRKDIDARLDLHGMTQDRAHRALFGFLRRAQGDGASFVLVITGKGRISAEGLERGVLRRQVPLWLGLPEFRALVIGFEEAGIGHGGEGALYIRVRRP